MQRRYSIDTMARYNRQMSHPNLIIMNNRHLRNSILIPRITTHKLATEARIDLFNDKKYTWQ
ncbi:hypothetical protein D3C71_1075000 [compost metagenome]